MRTPQLILIGAAATLATTASAFVVPAASFTPRTSGVARAHQVFESRSPSVRMSATSPQYSDPDQPARFAAQKAADSQRALRIEEIFDRGALKGQRVLITGANRGLGLAISKEAIECGAQVIAVCRKSSPELSAAKPAQVIEGVDLTSDSSVEKMVASIGSPVDVVINNAGYFMRERETILGGVMDFKDEMMTIDICAVAPLRVTYALYKSGKIPQGGKIIFITSQGGSIAWRDTQCPEGGDYGHHMSKAAANMGAKLVANELKGKASVGIFHPGFNKTEMTSKYSHIWEIEGAVDASVGAKRVLHEVNELTMDKSGRFVNCEDGLDIPW